MVVCIYNPNYSAGKYRKIEVPGKPGQKVNETLSQQTIWALWLSSVISAIQEADGGGSWSTANPGQIQDPV
jgi:hypothetical protein